MIDCTWLVAPETWWNPYEVQQALRPLPLPLFSRVSRGEEHREAGSITESQLQDRSGRVAVQRLGGRVLFQEEAMHFVPENFRLTQKRKT